MKKYIVDTNITLRYLVQEGTEQNEKARALFARVDAGELILVVPEIVVAEVIWVLKSYYQQERTTIATYLEKFLKSDNLECSDAMIEAVRLYGLHNLDIVDLYLYATSLTTKLPVITWDNKLRGLNFENYPPEDLL